MSGKNVVQKILARAAGKDADRGHARRRSRHDDGCWGAARCAIASPRRRATGESSSARRRLTRVIEKIYVELYS